MRSPVAWVARRVAKGLAIAVAVIALIAVFSWVVMLLWNYLVPELFHGPVLGYWQAFGLLALCRILFGGGGRGLGSSHARGRLRERFAERLGERTAERWDRMTPEERERFRQGMRGRCGFGPSTSESTGQ